MFLTNLLITAGAYALIPALFTALLIPVVLIVSDIWCHDPLRRKAVRYYSIAAPLMFICLSGCLFSLALLAGMTAKAVSG